MGAWHGIVTPRYMLHPPAHCSRHVGISLRFLAPFNWCLGHESPSSVAKEEFLRAPVGLGRSGLSMPC